MPFVSCQLCSKQFYAKPNWIKVGWGKYCSRGCTHASQKKGNWLTCFICKKAIYKSPKEIARSKSGNFFCSKSCQTLWRNSVYIGPNHSNWKSGEKSYREIIIRSNTTQECKRCKINDNRILAVHHLDRNRQNNKLENLVWLCHNCHYLIHHDKKEDKLFMEALV